MSLSQLRSISATDEQGRGAGRVVDIVVRWTGNDAYPPVTGVVLQLGEEQLFHPSTQLARLDRRAVVVRVSDSPAQPFSRREGELRLVQDVLGRQLVDVDGVKVLRAEELYLAQVMARLRLVAVAGGPRSVLARLLAGSPAERRQLVDWSAVQPFGEPGSELRLQLPHEGIRRLHPGELADLLEELDRQ